MGRADLSLLLSFVVGGFYISFAFRCWRRCSCTSRIAESGPFHIGRLSFAVTLIASIWLLFELVNIAWPRYPDLAWYGNWAWC